MCPTFMPMRLADNITMVQLSLARFLDIPLKHLYVFGESAELGTGARQGGRTCSDEKKVIVIQPGGCLTCAPFIYTIPNMHVD